MEGCRYTESVDACEEHAGGCGAATAPPASAIRASTLVDQDDGGLREIKRSRHAGTGDAERVKGEWLAGSAAPLELNLQQAQTSLPPPPPPPPPPPFEHQHQHQHQHQFAPCSYAYPHPHLQHPPSSYAPDPYTQASALGAVAPGKKKRKRVVWSDNMHKDFMSRIFAIGLEKATPTGILGKWDDAPLELAHVKSHLQKYRRNSKATKAVFEAQLSAAMAAAEDECTNGQHAFPLDVAAPLEKRALAKLVGDADDSDAGWASLVNNDDDLDVLDVLNL